LLAHSNLVARPQHSIALRSARAEAFGPLPRSTAPYAKARVTRLCLTPPNCGARARRQQGQSYLQPKDEARMIPLRTENPRHSFAVANGVLIAVNVLVFLYQLSLPPRAGAALVSTFGIIPACAEQMLTHPDAQLAGALTPLVTGMFLHGGLLHLLGNMLFLWVFGGSVEDRLGHLRYVAFYMVCGVGSGLIHTLVNWGSTIPSIGASGAISGIMGAYIMLFPRARVVTLVPLLFVFFTVRLPAMLMLGYWFLIQFLSGVSSLGEANQEGVAWWAHIGGFLLGAALVRGFREN
jgi:membrane associated rhomboid family serine protease